MFRPRKLQIRSNWRARVTVCTHSHSSMTWSASFFCLFFLTLAPLVRYTHWWFPSKCHWATYHRSSNRQLEIIWAKLTSRCKRNGNYSLTLSNRSSRIKLQPAHIFTTSQLSCLELFWKLSCLQTRPGSLFFLIIRSRTMARITSFISIRSHKTWRYVPLWIDVLLYSQTNSSA